MTKTTNRRLTKLETQPRTALVFEPLPESTPLEEAARLYDASLKAGSFASPENTYRITNKQGLLAAAAAYERSIQDKL